MSFPRFGQARVGMMLCMCSATARVAISQIQPMRPIVSQHPPHLAGDFNPVLDVKFRGGLQSEDAEPGPTELAE